MQCCLMHINKAHEIKIIPVNCSLQNMTLFSNTVLLKGVVPGPAALASSDNRSEMQILKTSPRHAERKVLGPGSRKSVFQQAP